MLSKEQHNIIVDSIIEEIPRLEIVSMSEEIDKDFEEIIDDVINYLSQKYYKYCFAEGHVDNITEDVTSLTHNLMIVVSQVIYG